MSWQDEADEIEARRRLARELGGKQAVERQHARGRLTVRERIERLVDADSFHESGETAGESERGDDGRLVSFQPTNFVVGSARIGGRPCVVAGDDFTISGGAYSPASLKKTQYADGLAIRRRIPLVRLIEGGGASVSGAYGSRGRSGYDLTAPPPMNVLAMEAPASPPRTSR
jgi:acetyl-CoA carboxylase carboxyltransferase component